MRILAFLIAFWPAVGMAQSMVATLRLPCFPSDMVPIMADAEGFQPEGRAADDDGSLWTLYRHADGRFILVFTDPGAGMTCKVGGGAAWDRVPGIPGRGS